MSNTRSLVLGAVLLVLAIVFQLLPVFLSEAFIFLTVLSTIPVFIMAHTVPRMGITAYIAAGIAVSLFSIHEGIMFLCTNGLVGLLLGLSRYYLSNRLVCCILASIVLALTLSFLYSIIGIPVIGMTLPAAFVGQYLVLLAVSLVYNFFMLLLLEYVSRKVIGATPTRLSIYRK